jgi:iron-sulfur cluster repair protein YtfE (RIC family)
MTPNETRQHLLRQHGWLRELLNEARALAAQLVDGKPVEDPLAKIIDRLARTLAEHNAAEEAILEPILRDADAWGPVRVKRMFEEHTGEHAAFRAALVGDTPTVAARIADLAEELEAHMDAEERTFLSPAVLRDDVINLESSS